MAILYTLLYTGLRVSELVALNREDLTIRERSGSLVVRNGKGNVARKVPLSPEVRLQVGRYLETRSDADPAVFLSNFRQRISVRAVQHMAAKYGIHPHQLRHTFCRELVNAKVDLPTVADLAGHADINVTRRYAAPSEKELEEAIEKAFA
jgi:integrase/recombinase XerD